MNNSFMRIFGNQRILYMLQCCASYDLFRYKEKRLKLELLQKERQGRLERYEKTVETTACIPFFVRMPRIV